VSPGRVAEKRFTGGEKELFDGVQKRRKGGTEDQKRMGRGVFDEYLSVAAGNSSLRSEPRESKAKEEREDD